MFKSLDMDAFELFWFLDNTDIIDDNTDIIDVAGYCFLIFGFWFGLFLDKKQKIMVLKTMVFYVVMICVIVSVVVAFW